MTDMPLTEDREARMSLFALSGDALDAALARHFVVTDEDVRVGDRVYSLRKPANADHLISEADYVMDERLPYWADLWPSSQELASALLATPGNGRRLLELGCGLGLATLAAMDAGYDVTATDYYEDALHVTRANARRNLGHEPAVRLVNWRAWPVDLGTFDVVIAADVLYEKEYASLVAACIARALAPQGQAIVADPGRLALPDFLAGLAEHGLVLDSTTRIPVLRNEVEVVIQLLHLRHA